MTPTLISDIAVGTNPTCETITRALAAEFAVLPGGTVEHCVADTWRRMTHLGLPVTPRLVELLAREHLLAMVNSVPPSGKRR